MDLIKFLTLDNEQIKSLALKLIRCTDSATLQSVQTSQMVVSELVFAQSPNMNFTILPNEFALVFVNQITCDPNGNAVEFLYDGSLQWGTSSGIPFDIKPFILIADTVNGLGVLDFEFMYYYYRISF